MTEFTGILINSQYCNYPLDKPHLYLLLELKDGKKAEINIDGEEATRIFRSIKIPDEHKEKLKLRVCTNLVL